MKLRILIVSMLLLSLYACKHDNHDEHETVTYTVTSPVIKDTIIYHEYVCQIHSIQHIELRTLEKGFIQKIFVDEGQFVKKGQMLFQITPVINSAEVQKARAEVSFAEIEYLNTKQLADSNIVSKNELALAKATLDKAKALLALAQAHLRFTETRAPFDGIVGRFNDVRLGSLVDEGELLTTLSDNSNMWVYFNVPEAEYLDYRSENKTSSVIKVKLKLANNSMFNHEGEVRTIEADFNNETGNIAFRATFPNSESLLRNGQTGNILLPVYHKNAMLIPQKATFDILNKKYVFVLDKNNVLSSREIKVGNDLQHLYEVHSGLDEKDIVLVDGLRKVKNGQKINTEFIKQETLWKELKDLHAE
ncbi:MAG: efflux RND transporter periplasmic adaptor subunit [Flavobacteriales bacterium]|nr:efflux RND transporter periplasmic adaptor subunit [Flavobacteriales bacterium]